MDRDIVEQGRERPIGSPLRRRAAGALAAAVLLGLVVVRHSSDAHVPPPDAVISPQPVTATPVPTPTRAAPTPTPTRVAPPVALAGTLMPCDWFLGQVAMPKLDRWGATAVWTRRVANTQTKTYQRAGGEIRISAGCGEIKWVLPLGSDPETNFFVYDGPTTRGGDSRSPRMLIWRANNVTGWYRIEADGPGGAMLTLAQMKKLRRAIDAGAHSV